METQNGMQGAWKDVGEKYENMLRPIFGDRLLVKKQETLLSPGTKSTNT
jgi:hypothetical protein